MPRTRLLWQLFAAVCVLMVGVFAVGSWLTSVEMARLADEAAFLRLEDAAALVADGFAAGVPAPDATAAARRLAAARGL